MIYHRGGEPERAMHCWFKVMAHKPTEFVTVCCSMNVVLKAILCAAISSVNKATKATYMLWLNFNWSYELNFSRLWVLIMQGRTWSKLKYCACHDLYCLGAACPCLSWSIIAMRVLTWVVFVPRASFTLTLRSGSSLCLHRRMHETTWGCSVFMKYLNSLI